MSTVPDWVKKAQDKKANHEVGTTAEVNQKRSKPGPKKSLVERKNRIISLSEARHQDINTLESLLKMAGVPVTRNRSETVELAVSVLTAIVKKPSKEMSGEQWLIYLKEIAGQEDRDEAFFRQSQTPKA